MSELYLITTRQCARLLNKTIHEIRKILAKRKIDYVRDEAMVYKISLRSTLEYANIKGIEVSDYDLQKVREQIKPWRETGD